MNKEYSLHRGYQKNTAGWWMVNGPLSPKVSKRESGAVQTEYRFGLIRSTKGWFIYEYDFEERNPGYSRGSDWLQEQGLSGQYWSTRRQAFERLVDALEMEDDKINS